MTQPEVQAAAERLLRLLEQEVRDLETEQREGTHDLDDARFIRDWLAKDRLLVTGLNYFLRGRGEEAGGG